MVRFLSNIGKGMTKRRKIVSIAGFLVLLAVLLTIFGPALPVDQIVVGIGPGTDLSDMALQGARLSLDEGWVLLVLVGPECPECDAGIRALKPLVSQAEELQIMAAFAGDRGSAQAWRMKVLPNFPVANASERVMRQYYRRLPAAFLLQDGTVHSVWWNRVPRPDEILAALPAASG